MTRQSPRFRGGTNVLHEVRTSAIAWAVPQLLSVIVFIAGSFLFGSTALHDIFFPYRVGINVSLTGTAQPGNVVELYPLSLRAVLDYDNKTSFEHIDFSTIKNKTLEVRIGTSSILKKVTDMPVGERPILTIHHEVK